MNAIRRARNWLFAPQQTPVSWWRVILWWELRRVPFNLLIGAYSAPCLILFCWAVTTSGQLRPGEDAVEPLALIVAPFAVNACYTLGWLVELHVRLLIPGLTARFGAVLLKIGLGFSFFVISVPALFWVGYRLLQFAEGLR